VAAVLGVGGIVVLGQYFPEYALDNFTARTGELQQLGRRDGSAYTLSDETPTTVVGQLAYAPAALLTSLFRPVLFEVHNLLTLANAVEMTVLTFLFARILFTRNLGKVRRQIEDNPLLVFCVVFVIAFGIAVGLASSNLGTLSRYRCPLLPFFVVLLLVLGKPLRAPSPASIRRRAPETALGAA
jgi:branched-subunit amino acid transport protein